MQSLFEIQAIADRQMSRDYDKSRFNGVEEELQDQYAENEASIYDFPEALYNNVNAMAFVRNLDYVQLSNFVHLLSMVLGGDELDDRLAARDEFNEFLNEVVNNEKV